MKTIVVLGGGGFIAGHIERHYRGLGWRVVSVGRGAAAAQASVHHVWQLPHPEFAHLLAVEEPDLVVNAAGRSSVPASMVEPLADFEASTLLTFRILDDIRRRSPKTIFINMSSAAVYGNPSTLPVREDATVAPISPYGWHRRLSELVLEEHARQFGVRAASLRIFSAYGPGLKRQVVWDIAERATAHPDQTLTLQGCPEDSRDFVNGSDVAGAVEAVAARGTLAGECYNVASGAEVRIGDLAALILRQLGSRGDIRYDAHRRPGNPSRWHADIGKLAALGFTSQVPLEAGIANVLAEVRRYRD